MPRRGSLDRLRYWLPTTPTNLGSRRGTLAGPGRACAPRSVMRRRVTCPQSTVDVPLRGDCTTEYQQGRWCGPGKSPGAPAFRLDGRADQESEEAVRDTAHTDCTSGCGRCFAARQSLKAMEIEIGDRRVRFDRSRLVIRDRKRFSTIFAERK